MSVPAVGEMAPDFSLPCCVGDQRDRFVPSSHRGKNIVLVFYVLDWTPV